MKENINDTNSKRYFWLKLKADFFDEKHIRALRRMPNGDTLVIIYLKLQLASLKTGGYIEYDGIMPDYIDELALAIDEPADDVRIVVEQFIKFGIINREQDDTLCLTELPELIGGEAYSTERSRRSRERKRAEQNSDSNAEMLQCNANATQCNINATRRNEDIDIEKNRVREDIEIERDNAHVRAPARASSKFIKPTIDEIKAYCSEKGYSIDVERFFNYYEANGWKIGRSPMKNWRAAVANWVKNESDYMRGRKQQKQGSGILDEMSELYAIYQNEETGSD